MIKFAMSQDVFKEQYFERRSLFQSNCVDVDRYGWRLIDDILDQQDPSRDFLRVLKGQRVDPADYIEEFEDLGLRRRRIKKEKLYPLLLEGATIVLNRAELVSTEVQRLCVEVGRFVSAPTSANVYASFGPLAATDAHWDAQDVFVLQLSGQKRWRLYSSEFQLPFGGGQETPPADRVCFDEVLAAGDLLYVPRGWWHHVEPVAGCDTIHVTIAVHTPLMWDYLRWACSRLPPDHVALAHSLSGAEDRDLIKIAEATEVLCSILRDRSTLNAFQARFRDQERVVSAFNIATLLSRRDRPLGDDVRVTINSTRAAKNGEMLRIVGRHAELTELERSLLHALAQVVSTQMRDLRHQFSDVSREDLEGAIRSLALVDMIGLSA